MKSHTILVVEDDPSDESLTLRALRGVKMACSVVVARTGGDALDYLLRQGLFEGRSSGEPDLVFMDNTLPGIAGNDLIARIRAVPNLREVPLVVFSGTSDENIIDRCLSSGANAFVEKPLDMADYVSTLRGAAEKWLSANG